MMFKSISLISIFKHNLRRLYCTSSCIPKGKTDPNIRISILPNGVRVVTDYQPTPLACMSLLIEAGPRFETAYNNGITYLLEHMAYKGFCGLTKSGLDEYLLSLGARLTAQTTRDMQSFTGIFPSGCETNIVGILADVITNLELDDNEVESAKYNMCLEMWDQDKDPRAITFDYLHQTAFQGTSLAQRVMGPTKNIRRFDRNFAANFLCQHYQPYKICIVSSGRVLHDEIVRCASCRLCHLVGDPACESDEGPSRFTGSQVIYRDDSMPFAHVAIAFEAPGYTSPDYLHLLVASQIMGNWHRSQGGGFGNASRLARAAAFEGMCESFESFYITYRDIGLWGIYFVAKTANLEDMVENIQKQWMSMCVCAPQTDMERAANSVKLKIANDVSSVVGSCNDICTELMYTSNRKSLQCKFETLSKLKVQEIRIATDNILYNRCPAVVAVGPTEALPTYNRIRSGQYWLRV